MLDEVYAELGCNKTDISRWRKEPFSTRSMVKRRKIELIHNLVQLFELSGYEAERLADSAGLSLNEHKNGLKELLQCCGTDKRRMLYRIAVSERMIQYYILGMEPTKQALLAIIILLELNDKEMKELLGNYGYCLSHSLANDAVVRWYLETNKGICGIELLYRINETLDRFGMPLLMTNSSGI